MNAIKNIKYPVQFDTSKRVFYEFDSFVRFFKRNKKSIKSVKINPPKIGANNFGSVEVTVKRK